MLDAVTAEEPDEVFHAVLETLTDQEDDGAYQSVFGVLWNLAPARRVRLIAEGIIGVLDRSEELAGDLLGQVAFDEVAGVDASIRRRPHCRPATDNGSRATSRSRRPDGWLGNQRQRGRLRVSPSRLAGRAICECVFVEGTPLDDRPTAAAGSRCKRSRRCRALPRLSMPDKIDPGSFQFDHVDVHGDRDAGGPPDERGHATPEFQG